MFSRSIAALLAACLYCTPVAGLHVDQLHNNDVLNTGTLTIQLHGACTANMVLNDVGLHTYSPLDNTAEALWLTGQTRAGDTVATYYSMVLVDAHAVAHRLSVQLADDVHPRAGDDVDAPEHRPAVAPVDVDEQESPVRAVDP